MAILQNTTVSGSLVVTGDLTARQFILSSSVTFFTESFASGSTRFGDSMDDTMTVTGSIKLTGSAAFIGNVGIGTTISNPGGSAFGTTVVTIAPQSGVSERWGILELAGNRTAGENQVGEIKFTNINTTNNIVASISANNGLTGVTGGSLAFSTKTVGGALAEVMRITASGSVGIGTTNPQATLHIVSPVVTAGTALKVVSDGNSNDKVFEFTGADGVATQTMVMLQSGNVGIGTSSPSSILTVLKTITTNYGAKGNGAISLGTAGSTGEANLINFGYDAGTWQPAYMGYLCTSGAGSSNGALIFATRDSTSDVQPTERMRITSGGYVGIGTTDPSGYSLAVKAPGAASDTGGVLLMLNGSSAISHYFFSATNTTMNTQDASTWIRRNATTSRSINASGTINASGADYAEYMLKAIDDNIEKGDIVGINSIGKLTNIFADSVSFVMKSTDPSYVGGDTWFNVEPPIEKDYDTKEEYDAAYEEFKTQRETARQKVDRISFSGQIPCNVTGANVGDYIIPIQLENGKISGQAVTNPTFEQYQISVGKVWKIMDDGRAWIAVKIG